MNNFCHKMLDYKAEVALAYLHKKNPYFLSKAYFVSFKKTVNKSMIL